MKTFFKVLGVLCIVLSAVSLLQSPHEIQGLLKGLFPTPSDLEINIWIYGSIALTFAGIILIYFGWFHKKNSRKTDYH